VEVIVVRLFGSRSKRGRTSRSGPSREVRRDNAEYLTAWAAVRKGVEAFVEPETLVTHTTVVFVAHDGEWTRRRIGRPGDAEDLGRKLDIPVYDIAKVGYPPRMRAYNARHKKLRERVARRQDYG
jgi:hypothetical protein